MSVWPPVKPVVKPPPAGSGPSSMAPPPTILERGRIGFLDEALWKAWEVHLKGDEWDDYQRIRRILDEATPEFRAGVMNLIMETELGDARRARRLAGVEDNRRQVEAIDTIGKRWTAECKWLDEALTRYMAGEAEDEAYRKARWEARTAAYQDVINRYSVMKYTIGALRQFRINWLYPGVLKGKGPGNVAPPPVAEAPREAVRKRTQRVVEAEAGPGRAREQVGALFGGKP